MIKIFPRRFLLKDIDELHDILAKQRDGDDIFITKYSDDEIISNIILDFDGADDKDRVYQEVMTIHRFLKHKGVNSIVVSSTNKGYHFYIQVPSVCFDEKHINLERKERNKLFVMFTENLINHQHFKFKSLDPTNTHAGLGGNIRLIGSRHPKTQEQVSIICGEFIDLTDKEEARAYYEECSHYVKTIYKATLKQYEIKNEIHEKALKKRQVQIDKNNWGDPIKENDLRELLPQLYPSKVKEYDGYIFMNCPYHADRKPSCKVTKEWFYCTACGKKGNIWTLIKSGEIKLWNTQ